MNIHVLDEQQFEGGTLQAIRLDSTKSPTRFLLVRNEMTMADFVDEGDEGLLYGSTAFDTEAALRAAFLEAMGSMHRFHARHCTGWCGFRIRELADRVRAACEQVGKPGFPRWHCHEASVALALALQKRGYQPAVVTGEFRLDHPLIIDLDEPDETLQAAAHWWVEVDGLWVDITADQFTEHVKEYISRVHLLPAGAASRYVPAGPADTAEYETDDLVRAILVALDAPEDRRCPRR